MTDLSYLLLHAIYLCMIDSCQYECDSASYTSISCPLLILVKGSSCNQSSAPAHQVFFATDLPHCSKLYHVWSRTIVPCHADLIKVPIFPLLHRPVSKRTMMLREHSQYALGCRVGHSGLSSYLKSPAWLALFSTWPRIVLNKPIIWKLGEVVILIWTIFAPVSSYINM